MADYNPLLINIPDLEKHKDGDDSDLINTLLRGSSFDLGFGHVDPVIYFHAELRSQNNSVRELLDRLDIDYIVGYI